MKRDFWKVIKYTTGEVVSGIYIMLLVEDTLIHSNCMWDYWMIGLTLVVYSLKFLSHTHNSYQTAFGVHEMHGQMHPNYCQTSFLLVIEIYSSLAYFMMTEPFP